MNTRKKDGIIGTNRNVQGNQLEDNINNNGGNTNSEAIQLQPPSRNRTIPAKPIEPGINDIPGQKGTNNTIRYVSETGTTTTPTNCKTITLKINGKNYTFLAP